MFNPSNALIQKIREFNRYYTKIIGVLDRHILESSYSLAEARILYEAGHNEYCTAGMLKKIIDIDQGYLSRILKKLEKEKLLDREKSSSDGRSYFLNLTAQGRAVLSDLERRSTDQLNKTLEGVPEQDKQILIRNMREIENILSSDKNAERDIVIRTCQAGDAGYIAYRHGVLYSREYGFDASFEGYVLESLSQFRHGSGKDQIWVAERDSITAGFVGLVELNPNTAQLRWLLIEPEFRGLGIGKKLLNKAIQYAGIKKYSEIILWTVSDLISARHLYESAGFKLKETRKHEIWGKYLEEEKWELKIN